MSKACPTVTTILKEVILSVIATICSVFFLRVWLGVDARVNTKLPLYVRKRSIAFVFIVSGITFQLTRYYIYKRLLKDTDWISNSFARTVFYIVCAFCFFGNCVFPVQYFYAHAQHDANGDPLISIMNMARMSGFIYVLIMALVLMEGLSFLASSIVATLCNSKASQQRVKENERAPLRRLRTRTMRIRAVIAIFWASAVTVIGTIICLEDPVVNNINVFINTLPPEAEGFRIVQLSDLHIGISVGRSRMERTVQIANEACGEEVDTVVLTGDVVDADPDSVSLAMETLGKLRGTKNKFFVTGNHEHIHGNVERVIDELAHLGIHHLGNDKVRLRGGAVTIAGVYDITAPRMTPHLAPDMARALRGVISTSLLNTNASRPAVILLAHQPNHFNEAASYNFVDLILSGHTHAGQFFPATIGAWLFNTKFSGFYESKNGKPAIYVSAGTHWFGPPIRLTTHHHEVTCLTLHRG